MKDNPFKIKQEEKIQRTDHQFAGAHLPRRLAERLALWSIYYQIPKTYFIRDALEKALPPDKSVDAMILILANKAFKYWQQKRHSWVGIKDKAAAEVYVDYKVELKHTLQQRGLDEKLITSILQAVDAKVKAENEKR